jgi:hypothetical protein
MSTAKVFGWMYLTKIYGLRTAPAGWQDHYAGIRLSEGCTRGIADQCKYYRGENHIVVDVQVDDFGITGPRDSIEWFVNMLKTHFLLNEGEMTVGKSFRVQSWSMKWSRFSAWRMQMRCRCGASASSLMSGGLYYSVGPPSTVHRPPNARTADNASISQGTHQ